MTDNNNTSKPEEKHGLKSTRNQLLILSLVTVSVIGFFALSTIITIQDSMIVGNMDVVDLKSLFSGNVDDENVDIDIAFVLLNATHLEPDKKEGIYIAERTEFTDCISCDSKKIPVKIIYDNSLSFIIMNHLGFIDNAEIDGFVYRPVQTVTVLFHNGYEQTVEYDKSIPFIMSKYTMK